MESLNLNLTLAEIDVILQMIDKTQIMGVQSMRVMLALDAKVRRAVDAAQKESPAG